MTGRSNGYLLLVRLGTATGAGVFIFRGPFALGTVVGAVAFFLGQPLLISLVLDFLFLPVPVALFGTRTLGSVSAGTVEHDGPCEW